jgi:hypothetical protein
MDSRFRGNDTVREEALADLVQQAAGEAQVAGGVAFGVATVDGVQRVAAF